MARADPFLNELFRIVNGALRLDIDIGVLSMSEPFLKPSERKLLQESIAECAGCRSIIDRLQQIGMPQDDRLRRIEARERLARAILDVDAAATNNAE